MIDRPTGVACPACKKEVRWVASIVSGAYGMCCGNKFRPAWAEEGRIRLVICGTRDVAESDEAAEAVILTMEIRLWMKPTEIVSGCARGGDAVGEMVAKRLGVKVVRFWPDWRTQGKSAGFIRNQKMVKYADACLAIWDGHSRGTKHTIDIAKQKPIPVAVISARHAERGEVACLDPVNKSGS